MRTPPAAIGVPGLSRQILVADRQPTFWQRVAQGSWEPALLRFLAGRITPETTFLDLGAWVGPTALIAAAHGARVIAVEADPAALDQFTANLAANPDLSARIALLPVAVAAKRGAVGMGARRKPGDSMSSTLLADAATAWSVQALTPADLAVLCAGASDLVIKLDIEGGEYALLPAMAPLLAARQAGSAPDLIVSFHTRELVAARGPDEAERATRAALSALDGWFGEPVAVEEGAVREAPCPAARIATRLLADPATPDSWLMRRAVPPQR